MLPPSSHPKWAQLVKGEVSYTFKFLALKIALTRYQQRVKFDATQLQPSINELVEFFKKNENMLTDDIKTIFG